MVQVNLQVPYKSQRDNVRNPSGSCNVTSCAMTAQYLGIVGNGNGQLEDQMYDRCEQRGWSRHDPLDLAKLLNSYGLKDDFTFKGTWAGVKASLDKKRPVIVHGYFTKSGHIIVIKGYMTGLTNNKEVVTHWIVNDPWGVWTPNGYDNSQSGENDMFRYSTMETLAGKDGDVWFHSVYK